MKRLLKRRAASLIVLASLSTLLLNACGQMGSLYLPEKTPMPAVIAATESTLAEGK